MQALPFELIVHVLEYLHPYDLLQVELANSMLRTCSRIPLVWQNKLTYHIANQQNRSKGYFIATAHPKVQLKLACINNYNGKKYDAHQGVKVCSTCSHNTTWVLVNETLHFFENQIVACVWRCRDCIGKPVPDITYFNPADDYPILCGNPSVYLQNFNEYPNTKRIQLYEDFLAKKMEKHLQKVKRRKEKYLPFFMAQLKDKSFASELVNIIAPHRNVFKDDLVILAQQSLDISFYSGKWPPKAMLYYLLYHNMHGIPIEKNKIKELANKIVERNALGCIECFHDVNTQERAIKLTEKLAKFGYRSGLFQKTKPFEDFLCSDSKMYETINQLWVTNLFQHLTVNQKSELLKSIECIFSQKEHLKLIEFISLDVMKSPSLLSLAVASSSRKIMTVNVYAYVLEQLTMDEFVLFNKLELF